jgi:hypothetical protein
MLTLGVRLRRLADGVRRCVWWLIRVARCWIELVDCAWHDECIVFVRGGCHGG